jgi:hypothetical protein
MLRPLTTYLSAHALGVHADARNALGSNTQLIVLTHRTVNEHAVPCQWE